MSKRNKNRPGYKGTKVGWIPEEWEVKWLDTLCSSGGEYGAAISSREFSPELPRYIRITDITEEGYLSDENKKSILEEEADGYILEKGDFLFARSGATVGKTYLFDGENSRSAFAGYLIRFKPDPKKLLPLYLKNFTQSSNYWFWNSTIIRAGAQPNINAQEYSSLSIPLPPFPEQRKIGGGGGRIELSQS